MSAAVYGFAVGEVVKTKVFGYRYRVARAHVTRDGERLVVCLPVEPELVEHHRARPFFFPPAALDRVTESET